MIGRYDDLEAQYLLFIGVVVSLWIDTLQSIKWERFFVYLA